MAAHVTVDYRSTAKALKEYSPALNKQLRADLRVFAGVVAESAKENASWSRKIPSAISVTVTLNGAGVKASGKVPIAPLNERGKPWRHPLFGNRKVWIVQNARPFIGPAVEQHRAGVVAAAEHAVAVAVAKAGL